MGEGTTISLLTSINERLKTIIEYTAPQNKSPEQETRENVRTLHKGEFTKQVKVDNTTSEQIKIAPMNMKDIVATLAQMPIAVRAIIGIKDKNLNKFKITMTTIASSMERFAKSSELLKKGGDTLEKVAKSFEIFNSIDLSKLLNQFNKIKRGKTAEAFSVVMTVLVDGIKKLESAKKETNILEKLAKSFEIFNNIDLSKILNQFVLVDKSKAAEAFTKVLDILVGGIKKLQKLSNQDFKNLEDFSKNFETITKSFTSLSKGIGIIVGSVVGLTIAMKVLNPQEVLKSFAMISLITAGLGTIAVGLSALSAFLDKIIGHDSKKSPFESMSRLMMSCTAVAYGALGLGVLMKGHVEEMLLGIAGIASVMVALGGLAVLVTALGATLLSMQVTNAPISNKAFIQINNNEKSNDALSVITKFMAWSFLLTGATMALGFLIKKTGMDELAYGIAGVASVVVAYGGLALAAAFVGSLITGADKMMKAVIGFAAWGVGLTMATMVLGQVVKLGGDLLVTGLGSVVGILVAYSAISLLVSKLGVQIGYARSKKTFTNIMMLSGFALAVTAATVFIGKQVTAAGGVANLLGGIAAVGAIMIGLVEISRLINARAKNITRAVKSMALLEALAIGAGAVVTAMAGVGFVANKVGWDNVIGAGVMSLGLITVLGFVAQELGRKQKTLLKGVAALAAVEGLAVGAGAVVAAIAASASYAITVGWDHIMTTIAYFSMIVGGLAVAANVAGKNSAAILKGSLALAACETLAAGGALIIFAVAKAAEKIKEIDEGGDVKKSRVLKTIGLMGLVITEFGLLAAAAGAALPVLGPGAIALAAVEGVAFAGVKLTEAVSGLTKKIDEAGGKDKLVYAVDTIGAVIDSFKKIAGLETGNGKGFLKNAVSSVGNMLGNAFSSFSSVVMTPLIAMAGGMVALVNAVVDLQKKIKEASFDPVKISVDIKNTLGIFNPQTFDIKFSAKDSAALFVKIRLIKGVMNPLIDIVSGIGKMATAFAGGVQGEGENMSLMPLLGITQDGKPIYGNPVNLKQVASTIVNTLNVFTGVLDSEFAKMEGKERRRTRKGFKTLAAILDPVSKFAEMVANFAQGDVINKTITKDDGTTEVQSVDLKVSAENIVNALNAFAGTLFSTKNIEMFRDMGRRRTGKGVDAFSNILAPVNSFVDAVSKVVSGDTNELIVRNPEGKEIKVNMLQVATGISQALSTFIDKVGEVFTNKDRQKTLKSIGKDSEIFKNVVTEITNMTTALSSLDGTKLLNANTSFITFLDTLKVNASGDNITAINAMTTSVNALSDGMIKSADTMTMSIKKLDDVLVKKSDTRIKELNALADAMKTISDNSKDMESTLENLRAVIEALTGNDLNALENAANRLGGALSSAGTGANTTVTNIANNTTQYVGLTKKDIFDALVEVLSRVSLRGLKLPVGPERSNDIMWGQAEDITIRLGIDA